MMDLLDEMSIENTILLKEKDGQFKNALIFHFGGCLVYIKIEVNCI